MTVHESCTVCGVRLSKGNGAGKPAVAPSECCGAASPMIDVPGQMFLLTHVLPEDFVLERPGAHLARVYDKRNVSVCAYCARAYRERLVPRLAVLAGEHANQMDRAVEEWYRDVQAGVVHVGDEVRDYRK